VPANQLELRVLDTRLALCRLPGGSPPPAWVSGDLAAVVSTPHETSIVCDEAVVPSDVQCQPGWTALMVAGPLDFSLTGVLAAIAGPLAEARVSIFAVSTFDTDYVLVPADRIADAVHALRKAGHRVMLPSDGA